MSLAVFSVLTSCSVKKNRGATRNYHAFVARYNTLYNAINRYQEAVDEMVTSFVDNDSAMIMPHPADARAGANSTRFDYSIEKAEKAIALHSISSRPRGKAGHGHDPEYRKWMTRKEYNPALAEAWLLLGNCYYMKGRFDDACKVFAATELRFAHDHKTVEMCRIMQARCRADLGGNFEAEMILDRVDESSLKSKQAKYLYYTTQSIIRANNSDNSRAAESAMIGAKYSPNSILASRLKRRAKMLKDVKADDEAPFVIAEYNEPQSEVITLPNDTFAMESFPLYSIDKLPFKFDKNSAHQVVFSFESDNVDANKLIYEIAKFNFSTFDVEDFDISPVGKNLLVGQFDNYDHAESYIKMFVNSNRQLISQLRLTPISTADLEVLTDNGATIDDYLTVCADAISKNENK